MARTHELASNAGNVNQRCIKIDDVDVTFGQRCGRQFHENVRKLECKSVFFFFFFFFFFFPNYRYLYLDEVLCIYCATHSVRFLVLPFVQLKWKKQKGCQIFFQW